MEIGRNNASDIDFPGNGEAETGVRFKKQTTGEGQPNSSCILVLEQSFFMSKIYQPRCFPRLRD